MMIPRPMQRPLLPYESVRLKNEEQLNQMWDQPEGLAMRSGVATVPLQTGWARVRVVMCL